MPIPAIVSHGTLPLTTAALGALLLLSACGSGSTAAPISTPPTTTAPSAAGSAGGQGLGRAPGTSGLIAAVTGTTMQVQTRTDQTAVTWTGATTFTRLVPATLADVAAGSCVAALPPATSATASGGSSTPPTTQTAGSVQILAASGPCTGFGAFGGGAGRPGTGTSTGSPTPDPSASGGTGRGGRGPAVIGTVTAVLGSTFTVQVSGRPGATATTTPANVTVTTTGSTTYLKQESASAADVKVGECATALGKPDQTGEVAATSVALRPATNGVCTGGFGGRPGGGAPGAGGQGAGGQGGGQATAGATAHA